MSHTEDTKILVFNQYQKSDKVSLLFNGKNDECKNNPENSSTRKVGDHISLDFLKVF